MVSTVGKTVEISAGTRAGLSAGQVLDVYAKGQVIEGAGQRFFKPGEKIGAIRLTQVTVAITSLTYAPDGEAVMLEDQDPTARHIRDVYLPGTVRGKTGRECPAAVSASRVESGNV